MYTLVSSCQIGAEKPILVGCKKHVYMFYVMQVYLL